MKLVLNSPSLVRMCALLGVLLCPGFVFCELSE